MKKISILLLAFLFIGSANINAQNNTNDAELTTDEVVSTETEVKTCAKTGKICKSTCSKKANKTCCNGSKKSKSSFNFNKSHNYTNVKSSCSKSANKSCCKSKASNGLANGENGKAENEEQAQVEENTTEE